MLSLSDHIRVIRNAIPENLLDDWMWICQKANPHWVRHNWAYVDEKGKFVHHTNDYDPDVLYSKDVNDNLLQETSDIVHSHMLSEFSHCDVHTVSPLRANRYNEGQGLANHTDHIRTLFDGDPDKRGIPILSASVNLNDDYEGGEFNFPELDVKLELGKGDLLLFPSLFLYQHEVMPVKSGTRCSLVAWGY